MSKRRVVILYSTTMRCWEAWSGGRPIAHGTLADCQSTYPDALQPSDGQFRIAHAQREDH